MTYADGSYVTYEYDKSWRKTKETDQAGNSYKYEYDNSGNLTKVTDPLANSVTYEYNKYGHLISETDANGNTTTYSYDSNGNCTQKTAPDGSVVKMTYDSQNRLLTVSAVVDENTSYTVSYQYDGLGRVSTYTDEEGNVFTTEYDSMGNDLVISLLLQTVLPPLLQTPTANSLMNLLSFITLRLLISILIMLLIRACWCIMRIRILLIPVVLVQMELKLLPKKKNPKHVYDIILNSQGLTGIKESGVIRAKDNNRVYVELASKKPLSSKKAESFYQLKTGRGKHYIEFDVSSSKLEWVNNPRYHRDELTVKGDVLIENAQFFQKKRMKIQVRLYMIEMTCYVY